ncbi:MAG: NrdH-redoxin, partial [Betaproteobacteria bacterium]|nr:NrdH-redoxin [Betaproteobacteria bacterium]
VDIRDYGKKVSERLERWWKREGSNAGTAKLSTYYGEQPLHHVMERCTWHSAQHARQIASVLQSFGITPNGPITADDYAGLPMPKALWE